MAEPTMDWFEIARVFASPAATVVGAAAAVFVTWKIGRRQADIARAQRDIAFDKLKHDLFERRYEIYSAAKTIIEHVVGGGGYREPKLMVLRFKLFEARFFFPQEVVEVFDKIEKLTVYHEIATGLRGGNEQDDKTLRAVGNLADINDQLTRIYVDFPSLMQETMGFSQLTSPNRS